MPGRSRPIAESANQRLIEPSVSTARAEKQPARQTRYARPADAAVAMPVQHAEGWRLHRCGGIRRSSDARRARTPHAALASPAAARQSRVVLSLHARVWLRPET